MKKTFLVLGAIMFAFLFAGCKGAEDTSSDGLKEALLELADDNADKVIESLFENPKKMNYIIISAKDSDTLVIKDVYYIEHPIVLSFTLTDDGVKLKYSNEYDDMEDSFIIDKIELAEDNGRSVEASNFDLAFINKDETKAILFEFYNNVLSNFYPPHLYL